MNISELLSSSKHDNQTFVAYQVDFVRQLEQLPHALSSDKIVDLVTNQEELDAFIATLEDSAHKTRLLECTQSYIHHAKLMASAIPLLRSLTANA